MRRIEKDELCNEGRVETKRINRSGDVEAPLNSIPPEHVCVHTFSYDPFNFSISELICRSTGKACFLYHPDQGKLDKDFFLREFEMEETEYFSFRPVDAATIQDMHPLAALCGEYRGVEEVKKMFPLMKRLFYTDPKYVIDKKKTDLSQCLDSETYLFFDFSERTTGIPVKKYMCRVFSSRGLKQPAHTMNWFYFDHKDFRNVYKIHYNTFDQILDSETNEVEINGDCDVLIEDMPKTDWKQYELVILSGRVMTSMNEIMYLKFLRNILSKLLKDEEQDVDCRTLNRLVLSYFDLGDKSLKDLYLTDAKTRNEEIHCATVIFFFVLVMLFCVLFWFLAILLAFIVVLVYCFGTDTFWDWYYSYIYGPNSEEKERNRKEMDGEDQDTKRQKKRVGREKIEEIRNMRIRRRELVDNILVKLAVENTIPQVEIMEEEEEVLSSQNEGVFGKVWGAISGIFA